MVVVEVPGSGYTPKGLSGVQVAAAVSVTKLLTCSRLANVGKVRYVYLPFSFVVVFAVMFAVWQPQDCSVLLS